MAAVQGNRFYAFRGGEGTDSGFGDSGISDLC